MNSKITSTTITEKQFAELVRPLTGLPVSRVWRGYGSAIFFEVGKLTSVTEYNSKGKPVVKSKGEFTIYIDWSWRVERPQSIYFGSWSSSLMITNRLKKLQDKTIVGMSVEGRLPELVIQLSDGFWVHSFATAEGQTEWAIFLSDNPHCEWIDSERGKLRAVCHCVYGDSSPRVSQGCFVNELIDASRHTAEAALADARATDTIAIPYTQLQTALD